MFLDTFQLRKLELLHLLDEENRYYSISELAQRIGTANSTVNKTIEILKSDCQVFSSSLEICIKDSPVRSVRLTHQRNMSFHTLLKNRYIRESLVFHLLNDIFTNTFLDVNAFSKKYFISSTLVYNRVSKISHSLAGFDLIIDFSSEFEIIGTEAQIRFFYTLLYWEICGNEIWPFDVKKSIIEQLVEKMEQQLTVSFSVMQKEFYCYWLGVNIQRIRLGYLIQDTFFSIQPNEEPEEEFPSELIDQILDIFTSLSFERKLDNPAFFLNEYRFFLFILYVFDFQNVTCETFKVDSSWLIRKSDYQYFEAIVSYLNNLFFSLYHIPLEEIETEQYFLEGLQLLWRHFFFYGNMDSFHQEPFPERNTVETNVFFEFIRYVEEAGCQENLLTELLEKTPNFLFFYHHFLYGKVEKSGYLPHINVLLLWDLADEKTLKKVVEKHAPCNVQFYGQFSQTETIDLIISKSTSLFPAGTKTNTYLMKQHYSQRDVLFLEEKLIQVYLKKLRKLMQQNPILYL